MQGNGLMEPIMAKSVEKAGHRSGGAPSDQCARGESVVRRAERARHAAVRHQRVLEECARQRCGTVQVGGAEGARRAAQRVEGARARRRRQRLFGRFDWVRRAARSSNRTDASPSSRASAIWVPSRSSTSIASPPNSSTSRGRRSTSRGATPRSTCRIPAARAAARRRTR